MAVYRKLTAEQMALIGADNDAQVAPQPQAGEPVEPFDDKWLGDGDSVHVPASPPPASPAQVTDAMFEEMARALVPFSYGAFEQHGSDTTPFEPGKPNANCYNAVRAVTAAIGAGGQAVAVKPLEWTVSNGDWYAGGYRVHVDLDGSPALYIVSGWHGAGTNPYGTLDEAQAAAQANHDAYIRSCLALSQPHPADERVVEALRDALELIERSSFQWMGVGPHPQIVVEKLRDLLAAKEGQ